MSNITVFDGSLLACRDSAQQNIRLDLYAVRKRYIPVAYPKVTPLPEDVIETSGGGNCTPYGGSAGEVIPVATRPNVMPVVTGVAANFSVRLQITDINGNYSEVSWNTLQWEAIPTGTVLYSMGVLPQQTYTGDIYGVGGWTPTTLRARNIYAQKGSS